MKTLVIHPQDNSTEFLNTIYKDKGYTVIKFGYSKRLLKEAIKSHDRIIFLGHGSEKGLFDYKMNTIIDSNYVYLLREKLCVCVWCNADVFFLKYGLKGIYTGMIISESMEANVELVYCNDLDILNSNSQFAENMKLLIEDDNLDNFKLNYSSDSNNVIKYNSQRVYKKST